MTEPAHSHVGASSAERWLNCPGSVFLISSLNLDESDEADYTKEGTAAHEMAAAALKSGSDGWEYIGQQFNGIEVDGQMADAVQMYLDECRPFMTPIARVFIEERIQFKDYPHAFGTVDFGALPSESLLVINDFKYGVGVPVDVEDNEQLKYYAYGILQNYEDVRRVVLRIVQPRAFHVDGPVRRWETRAELIHEWVNDVLIPGMKRTELDHSLDAGPWCRFCPAKLICPQMTALFGAACTADHRALINISDATLGRNYQYVQAVKKYLAALEAEVFKRLNRGKEVPGVKLVDKKANRVWKDGAGARLQAEFGDAAFTAPDLKSPAEIEKLGAKAKKIVTELAYTPKTGLTVALDSDQRVGIKVQNSQEAFGAALGMIDEEF